jgi:hypothetical protein
VKESLTVDMMIREIDQIDLDGLQRRREWMMMDDEDEARVVRMVYVDKRGTFLFPLGVQGPSLLLFFFFFFLQSV